MSEQILSLPIEKKIGQLFFIGLPGIELDEPSLELLNTISPGGICLFSRNIREALQTRKLLDCIRSEMNVEPFLSIDQEGGRVDRLRRILEPMPAANLFKKPEDVEIFAELTARILRLLGFNMNFAPVVDVIDNSRKVSNNGLYSRSFGNSPMEATQLSAHYLEKLQKRGCLGCLKHFPGLGASKIDSHEDLPLIEIDEKEFRDVDLSPYREIFETSEVSAVMIAHASYPRVNLQETDQSGKLLPSSLSFNFVTELLRREFGFEGLAVTDDLEMGAILKNYGIGEACKMALAAGADMLAICNDPLMIKEGYQAVLKLAATGEISEDRIDLSLNRIAEAKNKINSPLQFDESRLRELSDELKNLKDNLSK
jgi:beta-N-acetylhexosaminidase